MLLDSQHGELHNANHVEVGSCGGPTVPLFPAPWRLRGSGLVILTRAPLSQLKADPAIPQHLRDNLKAPLNILMLVNYAESDTGPYQELLFIPGTVQVGERRLPSISNIFVSTESSVVNGRLNWGIPKYRCNFDWCKVAGDSGTEQSCIAADINGQRFFELSYDSSGLSIPVNTAWMPKLLKTLGQEWEGRQFIFSPSAKGRAKRATIRHLNVAAGVFPQISAQQVVAAFEITDFNMEFPVPQIL